MKQGNPAYGSVAFRDVTTGTVLVTGSTLVTDKDLPTLDVDGVTYPMVAVDVSSESHAFWTGRHRLIDAEGRIEAFHRRFGATRDSR